MAARRFVRTWRSFWILTFSSSSIFICLLTSSRFSRRSSMPAVKCVLHRQKGVFAIETRAARGDRLQLHDQAAPTGLVERCSGVHMFIQKKGTAYTTTRIANVSNATSDYVRQVHGVFRSHFTSSLL